jgi:hypothetical protein
MSHQLQQNRFELKYFVDERTARSIRDFTRSYLVPDEYADPNDNFSYPIHSVYLDGPGLPLCNATVQGHKNRYKLRIRYYDDRPENPVFFEIKRRVHDVIMKKRSAVRRSSVLRLLGGYWPEQSDLLKPEDMKGYEALCHFCDLKDGIRATGRVIVSYIREAWVTEYDNSVRVTFDRKLVATAYQGELIIGDFIAGIKPHVAGVVLELKFTNRFPNWMRDMVHIFNLRRESMAKYVTCVNKLAPRELADLPPLGAVI